MANAAGRLVGTVLSGWSYQEWGLIGCLWFSAVFIIAATLLSIPLPSSSEKKHNSRVPLK
jgi:predicted MFS family arabinose efflux permease